MEIKTEDYTVTDDSANNSVVFKGKFRLGGVTEYEPIINLLNASVARNPNQLRLDLRELNFLNSAGINVLSKFVIMQRKQASMHLVVLGSKSVAWQSKSLSNLQKLMPNLELIFE